MTISDDTRSEGERGGAASTAGNRGGQPANSPYPPPPYLERSAIQWDPAVAEAAGNGGHTASPGSAQRDAAEPARRADGPAPDADRPDGPRQPEPRVRPAAPESARRQANRPAAAESARPPARRPAAAESARQQANRTAAAEPAPAPAHRPATAPEPPQRLEPGPQGGDGPRADSVPDAVETPDLEQPYADLGLRPDEYERIHRILGRRPTSSELAMYSIMWSEHCSYKSSKVHLRQFSDKAPRTDALLAGIGENAGVIRVSEDLAVTFKVESHNHPSFIEPHQGAATGVGGIVRDILAMGARPVGVMDSLRFGAADHPDTARVLPGVVDGVGGYGNCLGLPNVGGEIVFDPCYQGNPLVNALCVGVLPADRLQNKAAVGPGNVVVLLGAKTGRDGIGGVSVLASATFEDASHARRPSVQVGDPFTEKLLIESCLEMYELGLVAGIQDLGGAGLTCALSETSAAGGTGMRVWLDRVPLREASMSPEEILASESQERMLLIVEPERMSTVLAVAEKWGVPATPIGQVTEPGPEGGRLVVSWRDQVVADVPPASLADEGPVYARPMREPGDLVLLQADRAETLPRPAGGEQMRRTLLDLVASPDLCDKSWVTDQYDRYVLGNTVLAQPENAGVLRIDGRSGLGVALSVDGNGRYARLDPYRGAQLALAEAYRNVAMTGAQPMAVTNCLNFGSPEDPAVMWQFAEAVRGLADGCAELDIPVTGGNVSFYNQTGAAPINPTPVVGVLGVLPQVRDRVPMGFRHDGDVLILLGETYEELSGSEWAWVAHRHLGGVPPRVDLAAERALGALVSDAASRGQLTAAHDLSDGGLAQALVEGCLRYGHGAKVLLPSEVSAFTALFSESTARAVVSVPHGQERGFTALCDEYGVPWTAIGVVTAHDPVLEIRDQFTIPLDELREAYESTLPDLFGQRAEEPAEPRPSDGSAMSGEPEAENERAGQAAAGSDPVAAGTPAVPATETAPPQVANAEIAPPGDAGAPAPGAMGTSAAGEAARDTADAGSPGAADAGAADAGEADAGAAAEAARDTAGSSGAADSGAAGEADAGKADAGSPDTADAGVMDEADAGTADAGSPDEADAGAATAPPRAAGGTAGADSTGAGAAGTVTDAGAAGGADAGTAAHEDVRPATGTSGVTAGTNRDAEGAAPAEMISPEVGAGPADAAGPDATRTPDDADEPPRNGPGTGHRTG